MDISGDNQKQVTSDDQELAKALAGVTQEVNDLGKDETAVDSATAAVAMPDPIADLPQPDVSATPVVDNPVYNTPSPQNQPEPSAQPTVDPALATVKEAALTELRPLIDKLDVSPEEKFNTYLLLIRSTDDKELIAPAHEAAKSIADEGKKAQALLDIIKEIDFLSNPQQ